MALDIKSVIKAHGMEVREVANKMGITPTALSQHINGKIYKGKRVPPNPSLDVLQRIADAIGCDVADFFCPDKVEQFTMLVECDGKTYSAHTLPAARMVLDNLVKEKKEAQD